MKPITEGYVLGKLLEKRGLSVHELAARAHVSTTTIYRLISGESQSIRISTLFKFGQVLGVSPTVFRSEDVLSKENPFDGPVSFVPDALPDDAREALADVMARRPGAVATAMGAVPLYLLSQLASVVRGDPPVPERTVCPPPFRELDGLDLVAMVVPPGRRALDGVEAGDVLYARLWKEGETPDPMDQDVVLCMRETGGVTLVRWGITAAPEGSRPVGRVVSFARGWI